MKLRDAMWHLFPPYFLAGMFFAGQAIGATISPDRWVLS